MDCHTIHAKPNFLAKEGILIKRLRKRTIAFIALALGLTGIVAISGHQTTKAHAIGFGGNGQSETVWGPTIQTPDGSAPEWFIFNQNYQGANGKTQQSIDYEESKLGGIYPSSDFSDGELKIWRTDYKGGGGDYIWYSIVPPDKQLINNLQETDMSLMVENRQNSLGVSPLGQDMVYGSRYSKGNTPYNYNLKLGSVNPATKHYNGWNSGTQTIEYGMYKGMNYEWRFLGYAPNGSAIGNPYFPDDASDAKFSGMTAEQVDNTFASSNWIKNSWDNTYSSSIFGTPPYKANQYIPWFEKYFLPQHPAFENVAKQHGAKTLAQMANYWSQYLMPFSDPSVSTGTWIGWFTNPKNGEPYYTTLVTNPSAQPNLRLVDYKVYDPKGNLIAEETRSTTDLNNDTPTIKISNDTVSKGAKYHIVAKVENMPQPKNDIKNTPITLDEMYSFDTDIGLVSGYSVEKDNADTAQAPYSDNLPTGKTATFSYDYTVPTGKSPSQAIQFNARIPSSFYPTYNLDTNDDTASITFNIAQENLAVSFDGYFDANKNPTNKVAPNMPMWVEYTVTKTSGSSPVTPDLNVQVNDGGSTDVVNQNGLAPSGMYDSSGHPISTLSQKGDYAVYWVQYTPDIPKICSEAQIPSTYHNEGLDSDLSDDTAIAPCMVDTNDISVSNVTTNPSTIDLASGQGGEQTQISVNYDLTNATTDGQNKLIPVVYTLDGRVVGTQQLPVNAGQTVKETFVIPSQYLTQGSHVVQVEANPAPRKYIEYVLNASGQPIDPYKNNIGDANVNVMVNQSPFSCTVPHTYNSWSNTFYLFHWWGGHWVHYTWTDNNGHVHHATYCDYQSQSWTETHSFYESFNITHVYFDDRYTNEHDGGWVDLLSQPNAGIIEAGYGFQLKVVTLYQTNAYSNTPTAWNDGCPDGRSVSPYWTPVNVPTEAKVTMPFNDQYGNPFNIILSGYDSGSWYDQTTTMTLPATATVTSQPQSVFYIDPNTKDGTYPMTIETDPFYGSNLKSDQGYNWYSNYGQNPSYPNLCDSKTVHVIVKGSYLDDLHRSVVQ